MDAWKFTKTTPESFRNGIVNPNYQTERTLPIGVPGPFVGCVRFSVCSPSLHYVHPLCIFLLPLPVRSCSANRRGKQQTWDHPHLGLQTKSRAQSLEPRPAQVSYRLTRKETNLLTYFTEFKFYFIFCGGSKGGQHIRAMHMCRGQFFWVSASPTTKFRGSDSILCLLDKHQYLLSQVAHPNPYNSFHKQSF